MLTGSRGHKRPADEPRLRPPSAPSIHALAEETFANKAKAHAWLRQPTSALDGKCPIHFLKNEAGCRLVEQLLHKIGHGIAA